MNFWPTLILIPSNDASVDMENAADQPLSQHEELYQHPFCQFVEKYLKRDYLQLHGGSGDSLLDLGSGTGVFGTLLNWLSNSMC